MRTSILRIRRLAAGVVAAFFAAVVHAAPPEGKAAKHKDRDHPSAHAERRNGGEQTLIQVSIGSSEVRQIARELNLGGYQSLPPGIRKNLARGKPLPPGIAKKLAPDPLRARLPVYEGYEWRVAGTDLLLVAIATAVVADVFSDVFD